MSVSSYLGTPGSLRRRATITGTRVTAVIVVVALVLWHFDFGEIRAAFHITSWTFLTAAVLANFASVAAKGVAWKGVVDGLPGMDGRSRYRDLLSPLFIGFLFNTLLAARVGEFVKVLLARRRLQANGHPRVQGVSLLGTVVVENLVSTVSWVVLVIGIGLVMPLPRYAWIASLSLGIACLAVILLAMVSSRRINPLPPWLRSGNLWARLRRATERLWQAVRESHIALRTPHLLSTVAAASLASWLAQWAGIFFTLEAFGLNVGWGGAGLLLVTVTLAQAFPLLPGNLVMFQTAAVLPLTATYGVSATDAIAFSIVLQGTEAVVGVAVGFLFLLHEGAGFGQLRRDAAVEEEQLAQQTARTPGAA
ncbi:MAG TPA: lysylphosphatidylglycerol synthase transmembrane domain-containing protein [Miltoncostaeaceae bacterium]|nr:lysylphosphatidylglycerol synthase transmembrane domain-containing protein [Miltoncostaeaceae bacterium]